MITELTLLIIPFIITQRLPIDLQVASVLISKPQTGPFSQLCRLITGTIDKRAPQPHMNDLRACGLNNGLVLFFLYLGTWATVPLKGFFEEDIGPYQGYMCIVGCKFPNFPDMGRLWL